MGRFTCVGVTRKRILRTPCFRPALGPCEWHPQSCTLWCFRLEEHGHHITVIFFLQAFRGDSRNHEQHVKNVTIHREVLSSNPRPYNDVLGSNRRLYASFACQDCSIWSLTRWRARRMEVLLCFLRIRWNCTKTALHLEDIFFRSHTFCNEEFNCSKKKKDILNSFSTSSFAQARKFLDPWRM